MLTKSDYMKYVECPIYLWLLKHQPELIPKNTPDLERIFATGREVDELAKQLFPRELKQRDLTARAGKTQSGLWLKIHP